MLVLPRYILQKPREHRTLHLEGGKGMVAESCLYGQEMREEAFTTTFEIIYLLKGSLRLTNSYQSLTIREGEVVSIKKGTYFQFHKQTTPNGSYESILVFLRNEFISDFKDLAASTNETGRLARPFESVSSNDNDFVRSLKSFFEMEGDFLLHKEPIHHLVTNLIAKNPDIGNQLLESVQSTTSHQLVAFMKDHFTQNLTLEEFAHLTNRSLATFKRDFVRAFGTSPHKWMLAKRLERAHYCITQLGKTATQVYLELGFEDISHFSRSYKNHFGYSPSQREARLREVAI